MDQESPLLMAQRLLEPDAERFIAVDDNRLDAEIAVTRLVDAVERLITARWGYLGAITALDIVSKAEDDQALPGGRFEVLYIFFNGNATLVLRVRVPYDCPEVPSICKVIPAATLYERELIEMFGIDVHGTPVKDRLVLPDDWPAGVYPLRKSFTGFGGRDVIGGEINGTQGS